MIAGARCTKFPQVQGGARQATTSPPRRGRQTRQPRRGPGQSSIAIIIVQRLSNPPSASPTAAHGLRYDRYVSAVLRVLSEGRRGVLNPARAVCWEAPRRQCRGQRVHHRPVRHRVIVLTFVLTFTPESHLWLIIIHFFFIPNTEPHNRRNDPGTRKHANVARPRPGSDADHL